jgi:hypothetical protein
MNSLFKLFKKYSNYHYKMSEQKIDYLEVDDPIPGQQYVCLSFVSPEDMIETKESFKVAKFLQSVCKDKDMDFKKVMDQYKDFTYKFQDELQKDFDEQNNFKTNIRGLKVRGVYNTKDEADRRAKKLQTLDSDFNVFVGQVGYWLPWDPCADKIDDEVFINSQLNDMMEKYKENTINKDLFYEEQKREKVKAAREEVIRKKQEEIAQKKANEIEDKNNNSDGDESIKLTRTQSEEDLLLTGASVDEELCPSCPKNNGDPVTKKEDICSDCPNAGDCSGGGCETEQSPEPEPSNPPTPTKGDEVDEDLKKSLEEVDPWMANKLKESDDCSS